MILKKEIWLIFAFFFLTVACSNKPKPDTVCHGSFSHEYDNGTVFTGKCIKGKPVGLWTWQFASGGSQTSQHKDFLSNGKVAKTVAYDKKYYPNGNIESESQGIVLCGDSRMAGSCSIPHSGGGYDSLTYGCETSYYQSGIRKERKCYSNDPFQLSSWSGTTVDIEGSTEVFFEDGSLKLSIEFYRGCRIDEKAYRPSGMIEHHLERYQQTSGSDNCEGYRLKRRWHPNGVQESEYKYYPSGTLEYSKEWDMAGNLISEYPYRYR